MDTLPGTSQRRRKGPTEAACEKAMAAWRKAGADIDPLMASQLRGAAADVDSATTDHRQGAGGVFPITRARALLLEVYTHAAPDDTGADPLDDALVSLLASADVPPP